MNPIEIADSCFETHIVNNAYPGRGLVVGRMMQKDHWAIVYFIMGRSENSRNRRFVADGDRLYTEPVDTNRMTDSSLIIYDAMLAAPGVQLVSNGDQTRTVLDAIQNGKSFTEALSLREREPDAPNYTPRISAMLDFRGPTVGLQLSILKGNRTNPELTDRITFMPALPPRGIGYGLTTYVCDGNPLPSFAGDPLVLPLQRDASDILETYWNALSMENRVSLAIKEITARGDCEQIHIRNRHP